MEEKDVIQGKPVYHEANPGQIGILTGHKETFLFLMAEVNWGTKVEFVDITRLHVPDASGRANIESDVEGSRYGTIDDLRRRTTFEKLHGTLTDVFYSMKTSEIDFYAHQFKPVLRFIDSPTNRLLIADEVGLGKTIEAGLIWTEWQARQQARRLLVVCPPTLVPKWIRELQDRFQVPAQEAKDISTLFGYFEQFKKKGSKVSFVLVTSYHAIRPFNEDKIQLHHLLNESLDSLGKVSERANLLHSIRMQGEEAFQSDTVPFLDMVIFDEAHSMKNTASATYMVGNLLSAAAASTLCLSATPIHNNSRDLYSLLKLIDPEVFQDEHVYNLLRERNLPIVQLQNTLVKPDWKPSEIEPLISSIPSKDYQEALRELLGRFDGSSKSRVEMRHFVERLNLLSGFINRTRKRDILENRVIRIPVTFPVTLTSEEMTFHKAVLELVRREARSRGDRCTSFHLIQPSLRMSSSIPVIASEIRDGKWGGFEEMELLAEDNEEEFDFWKEIQSLDLEELKRLTNYDFEQNDSKYRALLEALRQIENKKILRSDKNEEVAIGANEKIIIFAFFKSTIAYLKRRLSSDGISTMSITGDIVDRKERDELFSKFARDNTRVLLCSEIGAEGVDLQFAWVVINYDLPWNPMRVEQRIGRIDRIGQQSPKIVIINFHVKNTIDGTIFSHLYRKIGVFERSIGALEGILGEEVSKLTTDILRDELSMDQIAQRAAQTAEAVSQREKLEAELESSSGTLIAFQDLLSDKVGESERLGRFIKPHELRLHTEDFFNHFYKGSDRCLIMQDSPAPECLECEFSFRAQSDFEIFCNAQELPWPDGFSRNNRMVRMIFDPELHQKLKRRYPSLVLITHLHPFFRWITKQNESAQNNWHKVSAVRLETNEFPTGNYFYLIHRMTFEGIIRKDSFLYAIKSLSTGEIFSGTKAETMMNLVLDSGESLFPRNPKNYFQDLKELKAAVAREITSAQKEFRQNQSLKMGIRIDQLTAHFNRRIETQRQRIQTAEARGVDASKLIGFRKALSNLEARRNEQLARLQQKADTLKESFSEVACGLIAVEEVLRS